ncbi:hypothetical protein ACU6RQ_14055 [Zobellella denitrificans]
MPRTLQYRPTLIDELISNERINSYQNVFQPASDIELMGVYLWNAHVSGAIYPIIGAAEITLRNAIDRALRGHLGNFWWSGHKLRYRSFVRSTPPPHPVQAARDNFAKATRKFIAEQRSRYGVTGHITPTHHGVMAKTEFSTWGFMLDHEFMGNGLIWPSRLGTVFAGTWPSTQASTMLTHVQDLVTTVRDFRNRLFHHEPAWKRFGVHTEADALQHLQEKIGKIESLVTLIHPENLRLLEKNGLLRAARRACTSHEIRRFQHLAQTHKINSMSKLQGLVDRCGTDDTILMAKLYLGRQRTFLVSPV